MQIFFGVFLLSLVNLALLTCDFLLNLPELFLPNSLAVERVISGYSKENGAVCLCMLLLSWPLDSPFPLSSKDLHLLETGHTTHNFSQALDSVAQVDFFCDKILIQTLQL